MIGSWQFFLKFFTIQVRSVTFFTFSGSFWGGSIENKQFTVSFINWRSLNKALAVESPCRFSARMTGMVPLSPWNHQIP